MQKSLSVAVVCVFVGLCAAAQSNGTGCCMPEQFESDVFVELVEAKLFKPANMKMMMLYGTFDYTNNRIAMVAQGKEDVSMVWDFSKNHTVVYTILEKGKKCIKTPFEFNVTGKANCITKQMQFVGASSLGRPNATLDIETYATSTLYGKGVSSSMTVTSDNCYPVSETIIGYRHRRFGAGSLFELVSFVNIADGIKDFSVFTLPASCKK